MPKIPSGVNQNRELIVSYQGEPGAFSEIAARHYGTPLPCPSFDGAFEAILTGKADVAALPIENALGGSVYGVCDSLLDVVHDVEVIGEVRLKIVHALMGNKGARLSDATEITSHPQALLQCRRFLKRHPHLKVVESYDTAGSALALSTSPNLSRLVIASHRAAEIYGLSILRPSIADASWNETRFLCFKKTSRKTRTFPYFKDSFTRSYTTVLATEKVLNTQPFYLQRLQTLSRLTKTRALFVFWPKRGYTPLTAILSLLEEVGLEIVHFTTRPSRRTKYAPAFIVESSFDSTPDFSTLETNLKRLPLRSRLLGVYGVEPLRTKT